MDLIQLKKVKKVIQKKNSKKKENDNTFLYIQKQKNTINFLIFFIRAWWSVLVSSHVQGMINETVSEHFVFWLVAHGPILKAQKHHHVLCIPAWLFVRIFITCHTGCQQLYPNLTLLQLQILKDSFSNLILRILNSVHFNLCIIILVKPNHQL